MSSYNRVKPGQQRSLHIAALLLATALPLSRLSQSLWSDEASSVWFAHLPLPTLITALCDPHPPGYYLLLKTWLAGGESEFWLRLPSLLAAILAVALTYRLGRESCGVRCAGLAALLLAWHPLQSWYAGEARMYMLVQSLGVLLVWLGWRLLRTASLAAAFRWRDLAAYWLAALIALGIDYAALWPFGVIQLLWLVRGRPQPRRWLSLQAGVLISAAFLWLKASQLSALQHSYQAVFVAVQANKLGIELTPASAGRLWQFAVIGLALASLTLAWYWSRCPKCRLDQSPGRLVLIGSWLALLLLATFPRAFTLKRQLVVLLPYLALLTGYSLARLPRLAGVLTASPGLLITLLVLSFHPREPWRMVVTDLIQKEREQAEVIWVDELSVPAFDYYWRSNQVTSGGITWTPFFGRSLPQLPALPPQPGGTLWLVTSENSYRHLSMLLPADFHRYYQSLEQRHEAGIGLYRYRRYTRPAPGQPEAATPTRLDEWGLLLPSPLDTCQLK